MPSIKKQKLYCEALLTYHSIRPTQQRVIILKAILNLKTSEFSYTQIVDIVIRENPKLTQGGISTAFRMCKLKGLIIKLDDVDEPVPKNGRPRSKFKINDDTLLKVKSLTEQ